MNEPGSVEDYRIRFDLICKHDIPKTRDWKNHPAILEMVSMLQLNRKSVLTLFDEFISNSFESFDKKTVSTYQNWLRESRSADANSRDNHIELIRDFLDNNLFFEAGVIPFNFYYIYPYQYSGVNLNQQIEVENSDEITFPLLFSFRFSKNPNPSKFLEFHLSNTFNGDPKKFKLFLTLLDKVMIAERIDFVDEWIEQNLKTFSKNQRIGQVKKRIATVENFSIYFGENRGKAKEDIKEFLFGKTGKDIKKKGKRIKELAGAIKMFMGENYNASELSRILVTEFGYQLGTKSSHFLNYTKNQGLLEKETSINLYKKLQTHIKLK